MYRRSWRIRSGRRRFFGALWVYFNLQMRLGSSGRWIDRDSVGSRSARVGERGDRICGAIDYAVVIGAERFQQMTCRFLDAYATFIPMRRVLTSRPMLLSLQVFAPCAG